MTRIMISCVVLMIATVVMVGAPARPSLQLHLEFLGGVLLIVGLSIIVIGLNPGA